MLKRSVIFERSNGRIVIERTKYAIEFSKEDEGALTVNWLTYEVEMIPGFLENIKYVLGEREYFSPDPDQNLKFHRRKDGNIRAEIQVTTIKDGRQCELFSFNEIFSRIEVAMLKVFFSD